MKKVTMLKILNPLLLILALDQVANVIALKFAWSETVMKIHEWNGYAIGVVVLLHIVLNWNWVTANYFPKKRAVNKQAQP